MDVEENHAVSSYQDRAIINSHFCPTCLLSLATKSACIMLNMQAGGFDVPLPASTILLPCIWSVLSVRLQAVAGNARLANGTFEYPKEVLLASLFNQPQSSTNRNSGKFG